MLFHFFLILGLVSLMSIDLSHNRLRTLQNRTNGLFEDCLSIRSVRYTMQWVKSRAKSPKNIFSISNAAQVLDFLTVI
jgi:hypothetical protein